MSLSNYISKRRQFPSKLLLFGEYGILLGLDALAIPFNQFSGRLGRTGQVIDDSFQAILPHLKKVSVSLPYKFDLEQFEKDLGGGLQFQSNIPLNYGLGSSGALVAAIFENYFQQKRKKDRVDLRALKTTLALIESYFHGVSSGIDPLVSLLNQPVLVRNSGGVLALEKPVLPSKRKLRFFLVDSNMSGNTGNMVEQFMQKMNDTHFSNSFRKVYKESSNEAISSLFEQNYSKFKESFKILSDFQLNEMGELIPDKMKGYFSTGLASGDFYLKICGSGGGGYFLGVTKNKAAIDGIFKDNLIYI